MTDAGKPTGGKWSSGKMIGIVGADSVGLNLAFICSPAENARGEYVANAKLIVEAGDVLDENGLTPRQLAEQRDELLSELRMIHEWACIEKAPLRQVEIDRIAAIIAKVEAKL